MSLIGAVAQLVERFHGMEEARGSIPLSSTMVGFGYRLSRSSQSVIKALNIFGRSTRPR